VGEDSVLGALHRAETVMEQLPASELADTWFGYPEQKHHVHASQALTRLGKSAQANESQAQAIHLAHSTSRLSTALIQLDAATCLFQDGDTAAACESARDTLTELPAEFRTDLVLSRTRDLLTAIPASHRSLSPASDLTEAYRNAATRTI
jgi:hypothetical protein